MPTPGSSTSGYGFWLLAAALALAAGALASLAFVPLLAASMFAVVAAAVAIRPRAAVIALALASPFYDLLVIRIADVADIRILEILWLVAGLSLLWHITSGSETRFRPPPRFFTAGLLAISGWFFIAALLSGEGVRPLIEASQTVYLCVVGYLVAGVLGAMDPSELRGWLRPWATILCLVLVISLGGYLLGVAPVAQTVVSVPAMSVEYVQDALLVQGAGSGYVEIQRIGVLNLGPVGTAAMLVSILTVAFAFILADTRPHDRRFAFLLVACGAAVLLLTYSRAGWALAVAAAGLVIIGSNHRRVTIALAVLTISLALVASLPSVAPRIEEFTDTGEGSYQAHARMWVTAAHMIGQRPILGWGPGMYAEMADTMAINTWMATDISADQPHNWLLEIAAETGVVGGLIAIAFIGWLLVATWIAIRGAPLPAFGVWIATGSYVAMNLTLNAFRTEMMWVWFGAAIGVSAWYARPATRPLPVKGAA
ncbi:MAG: O-antigen ligase family protein [Coriobacteriia bacterium]